MAKHPLDLYQLFNLVVERGGLLEVRGASINEGTSVFVVIIVFTYLD